MKGFTFIELIVTVTIVLLLSGFFVASYNTFNRSQAVVQAAQTLKTNLVNIRTRAISSDKPQNCDELQGYQVAFPSDTTYTSVALCTVSGLTEEVGTKVTYTLPKTVTFFPIPSTFIFYVLDRGASADQVITLKGIGKTLEIGIGKGGTIADYVAPTATPTP